MVKLGTESKALNLWVGNVEICYSEIWRILLVLYNPCKIILVILLWSGPQLNH